jgi:hypothetical protein
VGVEVGIEKRVNSDAQFPEGQGVPWKKRPGSGGRRGRRMRPMDVDMRGKGVASALSLGAMNGMDTGDT